MLIQTNKGNFLIEINQPKSDFVRIKTNSKEELERFFGSLQIDFSQNSEFPYQVCACKQEFANALILMVKEIEYSDFQQNNLVN